MPLSQKRQEKSTDVPAKPLSCTGRWLTRPKQGQRTVSQVRRSLAFAPQWRWSFGCPTCSSSSARGCRSAAASAAMVWQRLHCSRCLLATTARTPDCCTCKSVEELYTATSTRHIHGNIPSEESGARFPASLTRPKSSHTAVKNPPPPPLTPSRPNAIVLGARAQTRTPHDHSWSES
jgi:hypothetical protein